MQDTKTKTWTRISVAALLVVLLAGVFTGGVLVNANVGAQDEPPHRTAYVDFLKLLKSDKPLAKKQDEMAQMMPAAMNEIDARWDKEVAAQQRIRRLSKPDSIAYRQAMAKQLDFERQRYQEKLLYEQSAKADLRDFAIKRFKALRNLCSSIAKKRGYTEVLNVVHNIDEVTGADDNFQALQQQLLVSPVLYYEDKNDITKAVQEEADKIWGETISFKPWDAKTKTGGIQFTLKDAKEPAKRNAQDELEIRLGQTGQFGIEVLDKGEPAKDDRAKVRFNSGGVGVGNLNQSGAYTAPDAFPPTGDTFTVTVRSAVDPTVTETVTIRLLDKDGNRMQKK